MRLFLSIILILSILFVVGCSKKVVIVKNHPTEDNQIEKVNASKQNSIASAKHLKSAKKFFGRGSYGQAQKHCEKAIKFDHRNWEAHYYLGMTLQKRHKYVYAIETYGVCLKYSPQDRALKSDIHYAIGNSWEEVGDMRNATEAYEMAIDYNPSNRMAKQAKQRIKVETTVKKWKKRVSQKYDG